MKLKSIVAAALMAVSAAALAAPVAGGDTLTVMSYNIRNATGMDNVRSVSRTAAVIRAAAPDVVAVLEVDSMTRRSGESYILGLLGQETGLTPYYAPTIDYDGGRYGIGVLAASEPLSVRRVALPGREEARAMLVLEFDSYLFAATHLSLTEADRLESARIISRELSAAGKPVILAGDLNDTPGSELITMLSADFDVLSSPAAPTYPADHPAEVIDYIMLAPAGSGSSALISCEVVDEPAASDHRPLLARLRLGEPN